MGEYQPLLASLALMTSVAWASGLNLYATLAVVGLSSATGYVVLPDALAVVANPGLIFAACVMYCVEFMADKTPGVDLTWDALHSFIRIPGGALLAAGAAGDVTPAVTLAAGLLGGSLTALVHGSKASVRCLLSRSRAIYSNWVVSLIEDAAVVIGIWAALAKPLVFLLALSLFLLLLVWQWPRLQPGIRSLCHQLSTWLGLAKP